jgi:hypothetical protein
VKAVAISKASRTGPLRRCGGSKQGEGEGEGGGRGRSKKNTGLVGWGTAPKTPLVLGTRWPLSRNKTRDAKDSWTILYAYVPSLYERIESPMNL